MDLSADSAMPGPLASTQGHGGVAVETVTFAVLYSLVFAACGGFVFYGSVRDAPQPGGFFEVPWIMTLVVLAFVLLAFPVVLLVLGLVHLRQSSRFRLGPAVAWVSAVAASAATALLNMRDLGRYFSAYHNGLGWKLPRPYWSPLFTAVAQLAVGVAMILLVTALARRSPQTRQDPPSGPDWAG